MNNIPIAEGDLDTFFDQEVFGQDVTIAGVTFVAIVTDAYAEIEGGETGIEGNDITLICRETDVAAVVHGTLVTIGVIVMTVVNIQSGNTGITRLRVRASD